MGMPLQFKFKLHPSQWELEGDDTQVFRALRLSSGFFLVTWVNKKGEIKEVAHTNAEVIENILEGAWVIQEN